MQVFLAYFSYAFLDVTHVLLKTIYASLELVSGFYGLKEFFVVVCTDLFYCKVGLIDFSLAAGNDLLELGFVVFLNYGRQTGDHFCHL